jgi:hypothetical protein
VDDEQDKDAVLNGTVDHDVVSNGEAPQFFSEIGAKAAKLGLSRVQAAFLVDALQQSVRGTGIVLGNVQPDFDP